MNSLIPSLASQKKAGDSFPAPPPTPHAHLRTTAGEVAEAGLSVVYEPENSEPILDIVFIHGLQGHPASAKFRRLFSGQRSSKTTQDVPGDESASRPVFWPADLLPTEYPQARIRVFRYQTTIAKHQFAGPVNKKSIFVHSRGLVNDLSRARPLTRLLLFVGHSLGGIVIKETLGICSSSNVQQFEAILQSTAGVVFLGTPYRGSPSASIGEIERKAAGALLIDTNSRILDSISLKNSDLERCQEVFSSLWIRHNFSVKTFQEGLPLKLPFRLGQPTMGKVVPDTSSCLGDPREYTETLDGNHREILAAELRTVYSAMLSDDQEKLEYFKFDGMVLRQFAISVPVDNTCLWLHDTPSFKAWTKRIEAEKHHGLLQIISKPGSGKLTLMRSVFMATRSSARKRNDGTCVILERCTTGMFHSLLYQLATLHPPCLDAFKEHELADLQALRSGALKSYLGVLRTSLCRIFSNRSLSPRKTAAQTGYFFAELTGLAQKHDIELDVCISRREHPSVTVQDCLEIRIEAYNLQDIRQYITQTLDLVAIVQKSNCIFLWVVLAVEGILKGFESGQNTKHILQHAKSLPKELEQLFAQLLDKMNPDELRIALRVFQWAVLPTSRLRIREWHHILAFIREKPPLSLKEWKESEYYTQTDAQLERRIRDLSRGLVEVKVPQALVVWFSRSTRL
ncbi:hypothetical protein C8A05DRAFT_47370 [Staphylotrichum tortipilum]|uniref:Nephrocystin 3-like N-terminal domain-containing protein n=1 Tax=Staphylotrichum tortipilum TaxID=2831512 RepID=A0AAN6ME32_9PEZI|nr:hypothetical protein C8A05DRAFT_47370 [Staphylotrichum longicolle]